MLTNIECYVTGMVLKMIYKEYFPLSILLCFLIGPQDARLGISSPHS